ncbi:MAG: hypothetical protein HKN30_06290, partial [Sulfitobacter sp.]|nr:hypothetical protein [Sulfitobacter sp.]
MLRLLAHALTLCLFASLASASPDWWRSEWPDTDFSKTSVESWAEIMSGGPPKDGIPALDGPQFRRAKDVRG